MSKIYKCPDPVYLTRAFSEGADQALLDHLEQCENCQNEWKQIKQVVDLGRKLPSGYPNEKRLDDVRIEIFASALAPKPSLSRSKISAMALMIIAVFALIFTAVRFAPSLFNHKDIVAGEVYRAKIRPQGFATYSVESSQPNEVVKLKTGTLTVTVDPLRPGERFRVIVGNAEVIVRGTVFDVIAKDGKLIDVLVQSGKVEVRTHVSQPIALGPGQSLDRVAPAPDSESKILVAQNDQSMKNSPNHNKASDVKQPLINRTERHVSKKTFDNDRPKTVVEKPDTAMQPSPPKEEPDAIVPPRVKNPSQIAFESGWAALREGKHSDAAQYFGQAIKQAGNSPLVEDASFWHAVSLARAGKTNQAKNALTLFVNMYSRSPRRGEASVMLGWILLRAGDFAGAKSRFNTAVNDRVSHVRESAAKGLVEAAKHIESVTPGID